MNRKATREEIIAAADQLFYQQGYEHTSFADIADQVKISRGNFYHHFKSKDEILNAVINLRLASTGKMLDRWESEARDPKDCIRSYIHIVITNQTKIKLYGCPVGTLSTELAKLNHVSKSEANQLFALFRNWLCKQFVALGQKSKADEFAMRVLAWSQGVATMANAFRDEKFVNHEVAYMDSWLESLAKKKN
ncbi:MAG: TetR/AcrR family transcriptional regulator [Bdellovibrionota bacterium]